MVRRHQRITPNRLRLRTHQATDKNVSIHSWKTFQHRIPIHRTPPSSRRTIINRQQLLNKMTKTKTSLQSTTPIRIHCQRMANRMQIDEWKYRQRLPWSHQRESKPTPPQIWLPPKWQIAATAMPIPPKWRYHKPMCPCPIGWWSVNRC